VKKNKVDLINKKWGADTKKKISMLIGQIFALWSIKIDGGEN